MFTSWNLDPTPGHLASPFLILGHGFRLYTEAPGWHRSGDLFNDGSCSSLAGDENKLE